MIASGAPDEVINDPRVVEGYLGATEEVIMRSGDVPAKPTRRRRRLVAAGSE